MATITFSQKFGVLLLGIWLILMGLIQLSVVAVNLSLMGILALVAGIVLILDR